MTNLLGTKIVTAGRTFLDIDAYAGCIAYAELLNLKGEKAIAYSSATLNESITRTIRSWGVPFVYEYAPEPGDTFVVIDVSDPEYLDKLIELERVEEVIDHHVGYEAYWRDRIGEKANLEFIGAACTQVYEAWERAGLVDSMSQTSARLLISGILDNTLNFKAGVTTDRDIRAYEVLSSIAQFEGDWTSEYFSECEEYIFADITRAIVNDTKAAPFKSLGVEKFAFGQLVIWDAQRALGEFRGDIEATMNSLSPTWFINIVSIADGESYFFASDDRVKDWARRVVSVEFEDGVARAGRLWLRKEILKQDATLL